MATGVESYFDLTGNYGANVRIHYRETYDVATNASTVAITGIQVMSTWYYGMTYYLDGSITIAGSTAMSMSSSSGSNRVTISAMNQYYSSAGSLGSVSGIVHNDNGAKTITISATIRGYTTDGEQGSGWTASGSTNVALTTIPRKSSMSAPNGTLGVAQDLTVTRKASSFTHTITYKCGSASGTICTKSTDDSPTWTPPIDLATQNTKGTTVKIEFTITTYSGSTAVGSNTASATYTIPASIAPKCSVAVSDYTGLDAEYGSMVKGYSRLNIVVSTETSYGSAISTYEVKANGVTYTTASVVTGVLTAAGELTIEVKVTDGRGRSATASATVNVLDYTQPAITLLKVKRCNEDGSDNDSGEYTQVTFSSRVTALNDNNSAVYKLEYKKYADESYTEVPLSDLDGNYAVSEFAYIFAAESGSSYNVRATVTDDFTSFTRSTVVSTGATIMHWSANGRGMGIGKMSEVDDTLDMGWNIEMNGNRIHGFIDLGTFTGDIDSVTELPINSVVWVTPETVNIPNATWGTLETWGSGTGDRAQRFNGTDGLMLQRSYYNDEWHDWYRLVTEDMLLNAVYPVNSIYISYSHTSPASLFGGTWTRLSNRFLWATPSTGTIGGTGGESSHTLTVNEMPSHTHNVGIGNNINYVYWGGYLQNASKNDWGFGYKDTTEANTLKAGSVGGGQAHNNLPPWIAVSVWRRTA